MSVKSCCSGNGAGDMPPQPFNPPQAMNAGLYPLTQGKYSQGEYTVAARLQKDEFIEWIKRGEFRNFERDQFIISKKGHHHNAVYGFFLPSYPAKLAMKKIARSNSHNSNFHFLRIKKIRAWYYHWSGISASRTFFGSCQFFTKGIQVARPLACWTFRHGWKKWFMTDNYFLYEYQYGETIRNIRSRLRRRGRNEDAHQWCCIIFSFIKLVHSAGLRHSDQAPHNFIAYTRQQTECFPDIKLASISLIDMDFAKRAKYWHRLVPAVKYFFDLKDLAEVLTKGKTTDVRLLRVYLGREPTSYDLCMINFWRRGGLNIRQKVKVRIAVLCKRIKRLKNKHLPCNSPKHQESHPHN